MKLKFKLKRTIGLIDGNYREKKRGDVGAKSDFLSHVKSIFETHAHFQMFVSLKMLLVKNTTCLSSRNLLRAQHPVVF